MPDSAIFIFCPIVRYAWTSFWSLFWSVRAHFLVPSLSQSLFSAIFPSRSDGYMTGLLPWSITNYFKYFKYFRNFARFWTRDHFSAWATLLIKFFTTWSNYLIKLSRDQSTILILTALVSRQPRKKVRLDVSCCLKKASRFMWPFYFILFLICIISLHTRFVLTRGKEGMTAFLSLLFIQQLFCFYLFIIYLAS